MRKNIKKQVLDLISSMHEMLEEIHQQMIVQDFDSVKDSLSLCYDGAVQIDTVLENSKDDCTKAIKGIEAYALLINQTFENLSSIDLPSPSVLENSYNTIRKKLLYVEHIIDTEIKVNYEILFLPYKASMWDSLESIWLAAKDDVNCQCFVMPVPYFDFNQNCEVSQMHWEADQMPTYVPITHYNDYNISQRKPDIIYFHNPYDGHNKITSVHPEFYSSKLKQYTDMLVYVPYFVTDTTVPEHLIELTGVYNADKVIVQSEVIKEAYAKFINKDKILVLGSPKFDKVISCMKNKPQVPEEWKEPAIPHEWQTIIQDKKVVFLNTHLLSTVKHGDKYIEKLKYIFDVFKNSGDFSLLWRPHPLSVEATQAMEIAFLDKYNQLVKYYKENHIGVYDQSGDLHRAIAISDAYYGDWSSVAILFGITGKPIMLHNLDIKDLTELHQMSTCWLEGNELWYSDNYYYYFGLHKVNIYSGEDEFICEFEDEHVFNTHVNMLKWNDKFILAPYNGQYISIYNKKDNRSNNYNLSLNLNKLNLNLKGRKFAGVVPYGKWIYLIGCDSPVIIRFNMENETIDYYVDLIEEISPFITNNNDCCFFKDIIIKNECFIVASCNSNVVLEFSMSSCNHKIHRVGNADATYIGICLAGEDYWLASRTSGGITKWNKKTGDVMVFNDLPEDFVRTTNDFISILYFNNSVWAFPLFSNQVVKINTKTLELEGLPLDVFSKSSTWEYRQGKSQLCTINKTGDHLIFQHYNDKKVVIYNTLTNDRVEFQIKSTKNSNDLRKLINYYNSSETQNNYLSYVIKEYHLFSLKEYLNALTNNDIGQSKEQVRSFSSLSQNLDGTCGEKIHETILFEVMKLT